MKPEPRLESTIGPLWPRGTTWSAIKEFNDSIKASLEAGDYDFLVDIDKVQPAPESDFKHDFLHLREP